MSASHSANVRPDNSRNCSGDLLVSRNSAGEAIAKALRLYVGRGRRFTVKELSNGTGVPDRRIESAMCYPDNTDWRPLCPEHLLSISKFLGTQFTTDWLKLSGFGAFELMDGQIPLPGVLAAEDAADTAEIVSRAADGEFCDDDRRALKEVGHREIARGMTLVSMAANSDRRVA